MDNNKPRYDKRKPRFDKKPRFSKRKDNNKQEDNVDRVVYTTRPTGPEKLADWQLKLRAISDCYDLQDKENYKELVEARFQELKHKQG